MNDPARHAAQPRVAQKPPQRQWSDRSWHVPLHRGVLLGELHCVKAGIKPTLRQQLRMPAGLDDLPAIQYANQVSALYRREPMRNDERRASPNQRA